MPRSSAGRSRRCWHRRSARSCSTRLAGTCIKHRFGKRPIKTYDKHGIVLRIETATNDVSFFKHHRKAEHRTGPAARELAPVKKSIYSLIDLREAVTGAISPICPRWTTSRPGSAHWGGYPNHARWAARLVRGLNFFAPVQRPVDALQNPRVNIAGIRRSNLLPDLGMVSPTRLSRQLRRLLDLGAMQTRYRNMPVLPHQGRTCRDRSGGTDHRDSYRSDYDLTGFSGRCNSTQQVRRVRRGLRFSPDMMGKSGPCGAVPPRQYAHHWPLGPAIAYGRLQLISVFGGTQGGRVMSDGLSKLHRNC